MALAFHSSGRRYSRDLLQAAAQRSRTEEFFGRRNKLSVLVARVPTRRHWEIWESYQSLSPRLPVSPSPRLLENKGVIKTDLV